DRVSVGPRVALDADGADRRQDAERLPQVAVETCTAHLLLEDRIGLAQNLEPVRSHLADDADREAGPGERLPPHHPLGHAELLTHPPHLVLEEEPERLD